MTTFTVRNFIDGDQLKRDLAYRPDDLTNAFMEQASLFAHYGVQLAQASRQVDQLKLLVENAEAAVYRRLRDNAAAEGVKVTEAQLEKNVQRHEKVIGLKKALNEAKQIEAIAKSGVEAFRHRRDMLIQHGLVSREEMKGELAMKAKKEREDALEDQERRVLSRMRSSD